MSALIAGTICARGIVNRARDLRVVNSRGMFLQEFSNYSPPRRERCYRKLQRRLGAKSGHALIGLNPNANGLSWKSARLRSLSSEAMANIRESATMPTKNSKRF